MNREEHRDRIRLMKDWLNAAMAEAAFDGYSIVIDTLYCSLITGGSYPIITVSTLENV